MDLESPPRRDHTVVISTLTEHLIPDLANLVLQYCWKRNARQYRLLYYGDYEILNEMENANCGWALQYACIGGYVKMIDLIIKNEQREEGLNWHTGISAACMSGYVNIVELMLHYVKIRNVTVRWGIAFNSACKGGYMEIVCMIFEKSNKTFKREINLNRGIFEACGGANTLADKRNDYMEIIRWLIEKGAYDCFCTSHGNLKTCSYLKFISEEKNVEFIESLGVLRSTHHWDLGLRYAHLTGNEKLVNIMNKRGTR